MTLVEGHLIRASRPVFIYRVKAFSWFARMMSSGDGVSNRNGVIGDGVLDSSRSWWTPPAAAWVWICPRTTFLVFASLWLWNERAHANTEDLAKTEGVRESDGRGSLKLKELQSSGCSISGSTSAVCLGGDDLGFLWLGLGSVALSPERPAGARGVAAKEARGSVRVLNSGSVRPELARCCRAKSASAHPSWMCVLLPWCCAASSDREAGAVAIFAPELQRECSWIRSDNDGLALGWAVLAWPPTPDEDRLTPPVDKRAPRLSADCAKDELVVVVVTELLSERLPSGTERRDGTELWAPEGIFKDANVPSERLFWLHIMEKGDIDSLVRALNEGSPKLCPPSPSSSVFCTCPDMSCDRLIPLRSGQRLSCEKPLLAKPRPNLCCGKSVGKCNACCLGHFCVSTEAPVSFVCASGAVSVWATAKQSPYLAKAKPSCQRLEAEGAQNRSQPRRNMNKRKKRHFVST